MGDETVEGEAMSSASMPRCRQAAIAMALSSAAATAAWAADANTAFPTPGEYRIDSDSTIRATTPGMWSETIQKIDGENGRTTVLRRDSTGVTIPPQVLPGQGPNRWCVPAGPVTPPVSKEVLAATACSTTTRQIDANTASVRAVCKGLTTEETWRRIDARTWEREFKPTVIGSPAPSVATARTPMDALAAGQLTPAQRAELEAAKAAMPSQADMDSAMATMKAELETMARSSDPGEAAAARRGLATIRGDAGVPQGPETTSKERWRRVAESCRS